MNTTQQDWERFWKGRIHEQAIFNEDLETWSDVAWKVGLEDWHRLFEKLSPGKDLLECGCGSGKVSRYMARRGFRCTLLDYSEEALRLARANFEALALTAEFVRGDVKRMLFPDGRFDVVYSGGMLEFFADIQEPIDEMVRVLKPGGLFSANMVPNKFSCQTLADMERTLAHTVKSLVCGKVRDAFVAVKHLPQGVSRASLRDYVRCCEAAGLASVTARCVTPFPALALGKQGDRLYARFLRRMLPWWRRFNESPSPWHESWGIAYRIYGVKRG
jgi:ubiquinone/menaquinone biosynthesis C-methylase UbiE